MARTAAKKTPAKAAKTAKNASAAKSEKPVRAERRVKRDEEKKVYKCLSKRSTKRDGDEKRALTSRINRAAGQINGIQGMLECDAYCTDILVQVAAVQSALKAFSRELIVNHLETVVAADLKKGETESMNEFVKLLQKQFMNG
ncbi:MAG: metal-sensing transcriptional repressor [Treponema sp.]|nr:metal-sensing transcriptional repressor [Treponema sp.]